MKTREWKREGEDSNARSVWSAVASAPLSLLAFAFHRSERSERRPEPKVVLPALRFLRDLLFSGSSTSSAGAPARSKAWRRFGVLLLSAFSFQLSAFSQSYSIDWHSIDGGGGTSTGGVYSVSGTIGQPDAGTMTGGPFTLVGGFWALPGLVQTPGEPTLYVTNAAPGWATVWWVPSTPGFVLQENLNLATTNWVDSGSGTNNPTLVPATLPAKFYRLRKP